MRAQLIDMKAKRKQKTTARVFQTLEHLYGLSLEDASREGIITSSEEKEALLIQLLSEHLTQALSEEKPDHRVESLNENYRRFDERLRRCLQTKLRTLSRFDGLNGRSYLAESVLI